MLFYYQLIIYIVSKCQKSVDESTDRAYHGIIIILLIDNIKTTEKNHNGSKRRDYREDFENRKCCVEFI